MIFIDIDTDERVKIINEISPATLMIMVRFSGRDKRKYNVRRVGSKKVALQQLVAHELYEKCGMSDILHIQLFVRNSNEYFAGILDLRDYYGDELERIGNDHRTFTKNFAVSLWLSHYDYIMETGKYNDMATIRDYKTYESQSFIIDTSSCLQFWNGQEKRLFTQNVDELDWLTIPRQHNICYYVSHMTSKDIEFGLHTLQEKLSENVIREVTSKLNDNDLVEIMITRRQRILETSLVTPNHKEEEKFDTLPSLNEFIRTSVWSDSLTATSEEDLIDLEIIGVECTQVLESIIESARKTKYSRHILSNIWSDFRRTNYNIGVILFILQSIQFVINYQDDSFASALNTYTGSGYLPMNNEIRLAKGKVSDMADFTAILYTGMTDVDLPIVPKHTFLFRCRNGEHIPNGKITVLDNRALMSTTLSQRGMVCTVKNKEKDYYISIRTSHPITGLYMSKVWTGKSEREVLLSPNMRLTRIKNPSLTSMLTRDSAGEGGFNTHIRIHKVVRLLLEASFIPKKNKRIKLRIYALSMLKILVRNKLKHRRRVQAENDHLNDDGKDNDDDDDEDGDISSKTDVDTRISRLDQSGHIVDPYETARTMIPTKKRKLL